MNLASKDYYTKIRRELAEFLLETTRADSVLRGSSKEYKAVQQALKNSMELLGKIEDNPKPEEIKNVKESLERITDATTAYKIHKEKVHSGSNYEKTRISVMSNIANSLLGKKNTLEAESKKHISKLENDARRAENKAERTKAQIETNKQQIIELVKNLQEWSTPELDYNLKKTIGAAIVAGSRAEYAMQKMNTSKPDPKLQMTKDEFNKAVDNVINTPQFKTYYNNLDKKVAEQLIFHNKAMEHFSKDFRSKTVEVNANAQQPQQQEKIEIQEKNQVNMQAENIMI